jgi:copper chaperone NosL
MVATFALLFLLACSAEEVRHADPDAATSCAGCRMTVSDLRFAGQLVASGEEPRFFDDIGCMRKYLSKNREQAAWTAFVSDYRSRKWIAADAAHFWKCEAIETPMSSHIVATESDEPPGEGCTPMAVEEPGGGRSGLGGQSGHRIVHVVHSVHDVHLVHSRENN